MYRPLHIPLHDHTSISGTTSYPLLFFWSSPDPAQLSARARNVTHRTTVQRPSNIGPCTYTPNGEVKLKSHRRSVDHPIRTCQRPRNPAVRRGTPTVLSRSVSGPRSSGALSTSRTNSQELAVCIHRYVIPDLAPRARITMPRSFASELGCFVASFEIY